MLVLAREKIESDLPNVRISLRPDKLGLGSSILILDTDSLKLTERTTLDGSLIIENIDLTIPRQLLLLKSPGEPAVIWHDLQTRKIIAQSSDVTSGQLKLELRGVPASKTRLLIWLDSETQKWVDVEYPEDGLLKQIVR